MSRKKLKTRVKKKTKIFEKFYSDGKLWARGPILTGGVRHGFWKYLDKCGQTINSGHYKKGIFSGKWKEYNAKGKKIKEMIYIN